MYVLISPTLAYLSKQGGGANKKLKLSITVLMSIAPTHEPASGLDRVLDAS